MATTIGAKIELTGEKAYREQLRQITQDTKTMHAETQRLESSWDKTTSAQQRATQTASQLRDQISRQEQAVRTARENVDRFSDAYGENDRRTLQWKEKLALAETELNNLNRKLQEVPNSMQLYGQRMQQMGDKIASAGRAMTTAGQTLTRTVSMPLTLIGGASVKMATDFETAMAKVSTIADETEVSYEDMKAAILDLSNTTGVAASEVAENVYQAISAGQDTADAVAFVEKTTKLAKAGFAETGDALDILTTIMNAYQLEAKDTAKVSDILITTQALGKTTVGELSQSLGKVIPTASAYNVELEQLASGYVTLTKNGIATAEATTYLNSMIDEIGKSGSKSAKVLKEETGKNLKELMDDGYSLTDVLAIIGTGAEEAGVSISDMFTNKNARKAANSLTQNVDDFRGALDEMGKSAGATEQAFAKVTDTTAAKFNKVLNSLKNTGIDLGEAVLTTLAPTLQTLADKIKDLCEWFKGLDDNTKESIVKFGLFAAAAGPVLTVSGKLVTGVGQITSGIGTLITKLGGSGAMFNPYVLAIGGAITAGVLLGTALKELSEKYGGAGDSVQQLGDKVQSTVGQLDSTTAAVEKTTDAISRTIDNASESMKGLEATNELTDRYIDELITLADKTDRTTEEQRRMEALISRLNDLYPDFVEHITDANGQLNVGTGEIRKYADELKKTSEIEALSQIIDEFDQKINESYKAKIQAEMDMKDAMQVVQDIEDKRQAIWEAHAQEMDELTAAQEEYTSLLSSGTATIEELDAAQQRLTTATAAYGDEVVTVDGETLNLEQSTKDLAAQHDMATQAVGECKTAYDEQAAALQAAEEEQDKYAEKLEATQNAHSLVANVMDYMHGLQDKVNAQVQELTGSQDGLAESTDGVVEAEEGLEEETQEVVTILDAYGNKVDEATGEIVEYANKATEAYMNALDAAQQSIEGQIGLFDNVVIEVQHSTDEMLTAMESQAGGLAMWNEDLEYAWNYAVQTGDAKTRELIQQFAELGISGAGDMHTLAEAIRNEDWDIVNSLVQTRGSVKSEMDENSWIMAQIQADVVDTGNGIVSAVDATGQNVVTSWDNSTGSVAAVSEQHMDEAQAAVESGMDDTENTVRGHELTLESAAQTAFSGITAQAQLIVTSMTGFGADAMGGYQTGMWQGQAGIQAAAQYIGTEAANTLSGSLSGSWTHGYNFTINLANGIYAAAQNAINAAAYVAQSIALYLHHSTPELGPLHDDDIWGAEMVENYANAMVRRVPMVERAAEQVAEAAAIRPQNDFVDVAATSGTYQMQAVIDYDAIYQAVRAGASDADNTVVINNREFARTLRDAGVSFA